MDPGELEMMGDSAILSKKLYRGRLNEYILPRLNRNK
jgi:hypothetical protein